MATQTVEEYTNGVLTNTYQVTIPQETEERDLRRAQLRNIVATLNQWAEQARVVENQGTNVTQAQLKTLFGRFATLCARLPDIIREL